jgi:hypothetical protein
MPVLTFKKHYIEPILAGRKSQTLRANIPYTLVPGCVVDAKCRWTDGPFARLLVRSVRWIHRQDIDERSARLDGFQTVADLMDALDRIYPNVEHLAEIRFEVIASENG